MASGEFDIRPATTLPAPPAAGIAEPEVVPALPAPEADLQASPARQGASLAWKTWLLRLWSARGLFGGLLALGIAWLGQDALITRGDFETSTRNYVIAIAILILSLLHPTWPSFLKRKERTESAPTPEAPALIEPEAGSDSAFSLTNEEVAADAFSKNGAEAEESPVKVSVAPMSLDVQEDAAETHIMSLPVRPVRSRHDAELIAQQSGSSNGSSNGHLDTNSLVELGDNSEKSGVTPVAVPAAVTSKGDRANPWLRFTALRTRLGWRITAPGLALSVGLGVGSFLVLNNNTASPLGGWLWAASLMVLFLTFLGAPGWPRGEGLLPTPWSDWFAQGVPRIPWKVEAALVLLMMAVATFMRVWNLDSHPGIFGDEGERGVDARGIFQGGHDNIFGSGWWDVPNMYFYALSLSFRVFGDNLIGDRMLSVISGLVAVWFVYKTARLLWGPRAGIIAGTMLAVSPLALQFSRLAGESTPTGALWAVGAYFLFMALRYRRWSDWVLSGFFWSFNLYFYASGKMVIPLAGAAAVYALIRWRLEFFKRYFLGFALMGLAFALTFLPYGVASAKDNWQTFMGRANETSIFSPQNQQATFSRYGLAYDPSWATKSIVENLRSNPVEWSVLLYQQSREVLDGVYKRGDQVPFYQVPNLVALAPFWAVLGILGLAYGVWKLWDPRYGISMLWFAIGMGATILTIDAPNYQRFTNAWPAMMLFPAAILDRIFAAGWPLSRKLATKWSALPIAAVLLFFVADSYREYFLFYPTTCPYCRDTAQARYVQAFGQDYKGYQMGVDSGYAVYFGYGSTRFLAKDVEGIDMVAAADDFPVTDNNNKGLGFLIYGGNADYLPLIHLFYPMAKDEQVAMQDGVPVFTGVKVTREEVASTRVLRATYRPASGNSIERDEPGIGTSVDRALPEGLSFPAQAEWKGGLVAPQYGIYTFSLAADAGVLELDGRTILQKLNTGAGKASQPLTVDMVLAKGIHDIKLSGTLAQATSGLQLMWASGGGQPNPIDPKYLFNGTTGGLSGEIGPLSAPTSDVLKAQDPFGTGARTQRRSDPFIGFREATVIFSNAGFLARWQAKLNVPAEGDYGFSFGNSGLGVVMIDGKSVFGNGPDGPANGAAVHLTAGQHDLEARYASPGGSARIELMWSRPNAAPEIIPPTYLTPLKRSWTKEELPDAPAANLPPPTLPKAEEKQPDTVLGGDLSGPRGVAVDKAGNVYVADRGNSRVVVYGPDGKQLRTWGKAAPVPKEGEQAAPFTGGEFGDILDLGVGEDGMVYVLDSTPRVQAFTSTGDFKGSFEPGQLGLYAPNGMDVGGNVPGKNGVGLYIAVTGQNRILHIPSIGAVKSGEATLPDSIESISGSEAGGADHLEQPVDVVVDPTNKGILYAIDLKDRIVQLTPTAAIGNTWTISRQWQVPVGREEGGSRLAISADGSTIYMSDPDRKRVDILNVKSGRLSYFGSEGSDPGKFGAPSGIAVGPDGRIYVVDRVNNNVQVFTP